MVRANWGAGMIQAVIVDKDGPLFDFRKSWGAWTASVLARVAPDTATAAHLARLLGFDPVGVDFAPTSPVIGSTTLEVAQLIHENLPGSTYDALATLLTTLAAEAPMVPAVDLPAVLGALKSRGLVLGLATNDTELPARAHLSRAGILPLFDFIAGCDSGWGGKPAPGQLLAFSTAHNLDPTRVAMVGDIRHDLHAARAAGMKAVAVLTGIATAAALAPDADVVLHTIADLPAWIDALH
jgi:phosphoglycolate phosphatase